MTRIILLVGTLALTACAPLSERELEKREYERIEYLNELREYERACHEAGGVLHLDRSGTTWWRTDRAPRGDYRRCVRPVLV